MNNQPSRRGFLGSLAALVLGLLGARRLPAAAPAPTPLAGPPAPPTPAVPWPHAPFATDGMSRVTTYVYDGSARLTCIQDGPARITTVTYDAAPPAPGATA